jgi:SAM-dependent methyltransferase
MLADHLARYLFAVDYARECDVLDAGCGAGYGAAVLNTKGARSVQACDIEHFVVEEARRRFADLEVRYFVDDCESLGEVRGPVDVICSFENIEHLKQPKKFLEAAAKLLSDGGTLLCSTPDRNHTAPFQNGRPSNPYHVNEWTRGEFGEMLSGHFRSVDIFTQVSSYSLERRRAALKSLEDHLTYLWSNPFQRISRGLARIAGKKTSWPNINGVAIPTVSDFPIVASPIADVFGIPFALVAVCRQPK